MSGQARGLNEKETVCMSDKSVNLLKSAIDGCVLTPRDPEYGDARLIYNRMHDSMPAAIVYPEHVADIRTSALMAAKEGVSLAMRGGGHHIAGFSTCDGGIVLDFKKWKNITLDVTTGILAVQPGVRLAEIDEFLVSRNLVIPTGTVSDTGLIGLTLGGGIGWLVGLYGLTCDCLVGADVVLADGRLVKAEDSEHGDLLWALKGGSGGFGVITELRYRPLPLPATYCGSGSVSLADTEACLSRLVFFLETQCPGELTVAPNFSRAVSGDVVMNIDYCYSGTAIRWIDTLQALIPEATWEAVTRWDFRDWQRNFDAKFLPPMRGYWKSSYTPSWGLDFSLLGTLMQNAPEGNCSILIEHLHGRFCDSDDAHSAFPLREARFGVLFSARWLSESEDADYIAWVKNGIFSVDPQGRSLSYSNYTSADDVGAAKSFSKLSRARLFSIKSVYDPDHFFKGNHGSLLFAGSGEVHRVQ